MSRQVCIEKEKFENKKIINIKTIIKLTLCIINYKMIRFQLHNNEKDKSFVIRSVLHVNLTYVKNCEICQWISMKKKTLKEIHKLYT